jgi:two-component system, response regulator, stage 0 sporulation protein F
MRRRRILVVEDNDDLRAYYRDVLSAAGFEVEEAADGLQALRRLDNDVPDLLVCDLRMPFFSGVDVLQELTRKIPVVVVTGSPQDLPPHIQVECVLKKPVYAEKLIETVQQCLEANGKA